MEQEYKEHYFDPFEEEIDDLLNQEEEKCHTCIWLGIILAIVSGVIGFFIGKMK